MRKKIGISFILLGIVCLLASAGFVIYNRVEAESAETTSQVMLENVQEVIVQNIQQIKVEEAAEEMPPEESTVAIYDETPKEMLTTKLDGYDCIGILSVPALELELPVLTDWTYQKLKKAPCHYFGSCYDTDFVIAAHNYPAHFGEIGKLQAEDLVLFTDIEGTIHYYEVVLVETLPATATKEMITSGFDLSLYTCTPGGASRVTVRCKRVEA